MFLTATTGGSGMVAEIGTALTSILGWIGDVISALVTTDGDLNALLPLWAIGIGCSALMFGVKVARSFTWGN